MRVCHHCGQPLDRPSGVQRTDSCPRCHSDLKCCLNCRFFDAAAANQCLEPQADPVTEKEKANFCEFFQFRSAAAAGGSGRADAPAERARARDAFDALFRKDG